jgi:hypothetical protein
MNNATICLPPTKDGIKSMTELQAVQFWHPFRVLESNCALPEVWRPPATLWQAFCLRKRNDANRRRFYNLLEPSRAQRQPEGLQESCRRLERSENLRYGFRESAPWRGARTGAARDFVRQEPAIKASFA